MKTLTMIAVLLGTALPMHALAQSVPTSAGTVEGITEGDVSSFRGIPYASPPVGDLRWRAPQPVLPWDGVRDASSFGAECAQVSFTPPGAPPQAAVDRSEDCLFLNVWRPADAEAGADLPVMVWIHGGAFIFGSSSQPTYMGDGFARQGVVLVTINYRLGRFGFFAHPALSAEQPDEAHGNYAYLDMIAALRWVEENIGQFGGDANNVTIFDESAGGVAVHSLLTSPMAAGLFDKAIIESGGGRDGTLTGRPLSADNADRYYPLSAETIGLNFARRYGINGTGRSALRRLRALSAEQIVDGGQETDGPDGPRTYSGVIVDGRVVVETAESAYAAGRQLNVPLMIGSNSAEVPGGFLAGSTKDELFAGFGAGEAAARAAYDPDGNLDFAMLSAQVNTDRVWAEPARLTARAFAANGAPAFIYRFSYVAESMRAAAPFGAPHASELEYVFDTVAARYGEALTPGDQAVARMVNTYWANFARSGNPTGPGMAAWHPYTLTDPQILDVRPDGSAEVGPDPFDARLDANELAGGVVIPR